LRVFRQSVLSAATSGELTKDWRSISGLAEKWTEVRLGEIADVQGGVTKDAKKQSPTDEEVPYLRVANVQRGYIDLTEIKCIRIPSSRLDNLLLEAGDILFNEGGDIDKVGRGWVWESQIPRCSFQNHVFRARLHDKRNQPKYISWWSNFRGLEYFLRAGKQTTNLASINKTVLSDLPISLPPHEEQAEIVRRVQILFGYADRIEARLTQAQVGTDRLTPALLAKAFRGELLPQDPSDEPASELLKRLAEKRSVAGVAAKNLRGRKASRVDEDEEESSVAE
jgi:type I restriction enzyme, S subunit